MEDILNNIKQKMIDNEDNFSRYACKSKNALFIEKDKFAKNNEIRTAYSKDTDRIIHSLSYTRYIDKTQVFSFIENDHITHRVLHVQLVSKVARTIGKMLNLNLDLIEAISLGHDVGHTPFGHTGEKFLNEICIKENIGFFRHNAQSVRALKDIENLNISLQTLDGILAHNGEMLFKQYAPKNKDINQFIKELNASFYEEDFTKKIIPMTLEGCIVRISDIIAYIGRDIEDAILIGNIKREDIPKDITKILGDNNSSIIDTIIKDIVMCSYEKGYISFSKDVYTAMLELKKWNYANIYNSKKVRKNDDIMEEFINKLFYRYLEYLEVNNDESKSAKRLYSFINDKTEQYKNNTNKKRMIIDYIAGQTDSYFLRECEENFKEFNKEKLYQKS